MDVHNEKIRSYNMSRIKGSNTKPELIVRRFLHSNGFRFRIHDKSLPGRPDIVLKKYNTVININGCFWHGHEGCKYFVIPKTRSEFWQKKINDTRNRDKINSLKLHKMGWKVLHLFECQLNPKKISETLEELKEIIKDGDSSN
jgi:DNA mismatch endonuclease (patch repair protein)